MKSYVFPEAMPFQILHIEGSALSVLSSLCPHLPRVLTDGQCTHMSLFLSPSF